MSEGKTITIAPQPGPQTEFLASQADIVFYGGSAGGGKTFGLLLDPLRHINNPLFTGVIFRRSTTQIRNPGGLWDESEKLYLQTGARPRNAMLEWTFTSGASMKFAHLEHDKTIYDWQGAQIPFIGFDELTHFSKKQFFYMMSRNRSDSGIPGYIRATCNPNVDSWVRGFIDWYVDKDGYIDEMKSGVIRYFIVKDDVVIWGDTAEELKSKYGETELPKSFTFIRSSLQDNKILLEKDPSYLASLRALSRVERARLLDGNWNIRETAGSIFDKSWFGVLDVVPSGWRRVVRFWDRAATAPSDKKPDPDWTRGVKIYEYPNHTYLIADLRSMRGTPGRVLNFIRSTAEYDGQICRVIAQQDPGSAGVEEKENFIKHLRGFVVSTKVLSKDKLTRALPVSAQAEAGNMFVLRAAWNDEFFAELEQFPEGAHDDIVDALSGAFNVFIEPEPF